MLDATLDSRVPLRFVILGVGRSRTSLLVDLLNQSPQIVCHSELFHANEIYCREDRKQALSVTTPPDLEARDRDPVAFLEACYGAEHAPVAAVGFKFLHSHDPRVLDHLLSDASIAKILIKRNHIYSFTSLHIAAASNRWARFVNDDHPPGRTRIEMKDFLWYCDQYEDWYRTIEQRMEDADPKHRVLDVYAEDLREDDPVGVVSEIFRFLGQRPLPSLNSGFRPQNSDALRERIENYDEFAAALAASPYAYLPLEDVHPENPRRRSP